jgi:prefoldin subunit 5
MTDKDRRIEELEREVELLRAQITILRAHNANLQTALAARTAPADNLGGMIA